MDGNGRWAKNGACPVPVGHKKGAEVVKEITRAAGELGVKYLTLYAFSTENWQRDPEEVATLMGLLRDYLKSRFERDSGKRRPHNFYRRTSNAGCRHRGANG